MQEEKKPTKNPVWSFFSSVRLTILLLIIIAVAAIAGTVIPQQEMAREAVQKLPPALAGVLKFLQLYDLYHSTWFLLLMVLLTVNLVVCSLNRLPSSIRLYRRKPDPTASGTLRGPVTRSDPGRRREHEDETGKMERVLGKSIGSAERKKTDQAVLSLEPPGRLVLFRCLRDPRRRAGHHPRRRHRVHPRLRRQCEHPRGRFCRPDRTAGRQGRHGAWLQRQVRQIRCGVLRQRNAEALQVGPLLSPGRSDPGPGFAHGEPSAGV